MTFVINILWESWLVLGQMAPYLLLGFLVAGVLSVCIPPAWIERNLGRAGFRPVALASLVGVPLPLCSCGVIPVSASLRRHGASRAATTSFLLSTPQTGVDSIAITYALMGSVVAIFRPIVALVTGLIGGGLVQLLGEREEYAATAKTLAHNGEPTNGDSCRSGGSCCEPTAAPVAARSPRERLRRLFASSAQAAKYGFVTLPRDIGTSLVIGVLIAGAIATLAQPHVLQPYLGKGVWAMLLMVAVSIPIYVCASGSVPVAASFIYLGTTPGAALAFLIAGPATNAATISMIWKVLGRRTTLIYLITIVVAAVISGLLLDATFGWLGVGLPEFGGHEHIHASVGLIAHLWAVLLVAVLIMSYTWPWWARRARLSAGAGQRDVQPDGLDSVRLAISGMTCSHCAESVRRTLAESPGVESVEVSLKPGRAVVAGCRLQPESLAARVSALGYKAQAEEWRAQPGYLGNTTLLKMNTILELNNVTLELGGKKILDRLSVEFWEGHVHALLGPNGAGKSTTASLIMGLAGYNHFEGDILYQGESIKKLSIDERARRGITLAWQEPARYEGLPIRSFILAGAKQKSEERLREVLHEVGLEPDRYLDRAVDKTLSGGERKRIELASILAMEPKLVLMDEPDSGIDVEALERIFDALKFFREKGATVILITHSLAVLRQAEHAFLFCCGKLVNKGSVDKIAHYFTQRCTACDDVNPELRELEMEQVEALRVGH
ncbi:MAG: SO_0444 family Cu/Zn efflux transporter [Planctomycetota bacterium]